VNKPGALLINSEEPLTVLRAVSLSGGVLPSVGSKAYLLRTTGPGDEKKEIALNLQRIMKHREPDPLLQANDVIFVPDSKTKKLKEAGATGAIQALMYSVAGAIVWR
jgi:polysaccharide export outer membrane protein